MLLLFYTLQGLTLECLNFAHAVYMRIPHTSGNIETVFSLDNILKVWDSHNKHSCIVAEWPTFIDLLV
jgi:hypothetical protein